MYMTFIFLVLLTGARESFLELESHFNHMCDLGIFIHVGI